MNFQLNSVRKPVHRRVIDPEWKGRKSLEQTIEKMI